jgi:hypothetical protein
MVKESQKTLSVNKVNNLCSELSKFHTMILHLHLKFDTGIFMKMCLENPYLINTGPIYEALCMNTQVRFIVAGDINSL